MSNYWISRSKRFPRNGSGTLEGICKNCRLPFFNQAAEGHARGPKSKGRPGGSAAT
jgi:hypothetical protein